MTFNPSFFRGVAQAPTRCDVYQRKYGAQGGYGVATSNVQTCRYWWLGSKYVSFAQKNLVMMYSKIVWLYKLITQV
jgi:hypothetical protein